MFDKQTQHMYNCKGVFRNEDIMLINLKEFFDRKDFTKEYSVGYDGNEIEISHEAFEISVNDYLLTFKTDRNNVINLSYTIDVNLLIPCSRCLEPVDNHIRISDSKILDFTKTEVDETEAAKSLNDLSEYEKITDLSYIDGLVFDTDVFMKSEILINLPFKVLCKEDCRGICKRCGINLNYGSCDCDTTEPDPRMSKILDVFNQFKEV